MPYPLYLLRDCVYTEHFHFVLLLFLSHVHTWTKPNTGRRPARGLLLGQACRQEPRGAPRVHTDYL